jgi:hypothetical protein
MINAKIMIKNLMWNMEHMELKEWFIKIPSMVASLSMNQKGACKARL